ncbi:MAG TPA: MFS transporter [Candidatus Kapabacteria bacterium]|nr:MFS transporter [Candidatus Kapabacteria bacterium]
MNRDTALEQQVSDASKVDSLAAPASHIRYLWLALLVTGYIGVYVCRKNLQVAIPLLQEQFNASRAEVGLVASYSTIAYAIGKFFFGAVVDKTGGRIGFLGSLALVALMGIAGGLAPTLGMLTLFYSLNRFCGAASWPAMVKLTPDWFQGKQLPFAIALLSLSFVIGGAVATAVAGVIANLSGNSWRAVMALPSIAPIVCVLIGWWLLPKSVVDQHGNPAPVGARKKVDFRGIFRRRSFWTLCALSFTITYLRETFNTWTVDFVKTQGGAEVSNQVAAFVSTSFDIMGAAGILVVGWVYGRVTRRTRQWLLTGMLAVLAVTLFQLPYLFRFGLPTVMVAIGLVGFLIYGPYSLLGGTLSIEVQGKESAGTVSGIVDGIGYFAGVLAGAQFGRLVDSGGYSFSFAILAGAAAVSAIICFVLFSDRTNAAAVNPA